MRILPLLLLAATSTTLTGQTWTQLNTPNAPTPRRAGAMAFDGTRLLLHGGLFASPSQLLDETWAFNGTWTLLAPSTSMAGRWGHQLVRDTQRNRLVTFGGRSPTINGYARDTFAWTGTGWVALTPTASPTARYLYGMTYDQRRDRVVLFGGRTTAGPQSDTWEFDGTTWQSIAVTGPSARDQMVMVYDAGRRLSVLMGGLDGATNMPLGDTWEYDGAEWREPALTIRFTPRYRAAGAYDTLRQRVVVYGGFDGQNILTETLEYAGGEWVTLTNPGTPFATEMYAGYDSNRRKFVTFGGVGSQFSNQTWEYVGASTAQFGTFGSGCATSAGLPSLTASTLPVLGQTFTMDTGNLPASTAFVFYAQGFSSSMWQSQALPVSLAQFGLVGCQMEISPDVLVGSVASTTASLSFPIPNVASLLNLVYFVQAFAPDASAPNSLGGMTKAGRAVFGS